MIRLSKAGEYAMILMIELAMHHDGYYCPLKNITSGRELSYSYMNRIARGLVGCRLIEAMHGTGGGYRLAKDPESYTVLEIMLAVDSCMPEARLEDSALSPFFDVWDSAADSFYGTLSDMTLAKLAESVPVWN